MADRQRNDLLAPACEKRVGRDDERVGSILRNGREGGVQLAFRAGVQNVQPQPKCARRFLTSCTCSAPWRTRRIRQQSDRGHLRHQVEQEPKALGDQVDGHGSRR